MKASSRYTSGRTLRAASIATLALAIATPGLAQEYWNGTSDKWDTASTWSKGFVPLSTTDVYIGYDYGSVTFSNPGSLDFNAEGNDVAQNIYSKSNLGAGNLTVYGNLTSTAGVSIGVLTFANAATFTASSVTLGGTVNFEKSATLNVGNIIGEGGTINSLGTLTIDAGTTMQEAEANAYMKFDQLINDGTINANGGLTEDGVYVAVYLTGTSLTNNGILEADGGQGSELVISTQSYDGTNGSLLAGGTNGISLTTNCTTAQLGKVGGNVFIDGTYDNTGAIFNPNGITLVGSLINGKVNGILNLVDATVQNVEFETSQNLGFFRNIETTTLNVVGSVRFDNTCYMSNGGNLLFNGSGALHGNLEFANDGNVTPSVFGGSTTSGTVTIANDASVSGGLGTISGYALVNHGTISSGNSYQYAKNVGLNVNETSIYNDGLVEANYGTVLNVTGTFENAGILGADSATAMVNIKSPFTQDSSGKLQFAINTTQNGVIDFTNTVALNGGVNVLLAKGYTPLAGTTWDIMNFTDGYTGTLIAPDGYTLVYLSNQIDLRFVKAVPEPAPICVLAVGALGLFLRRRKS